MKNKIFIFAFIILCSIYTLNAQTYYGTVSKNIN